MFLEKFWRGGHFRSKKLHLHSFAPSAYWLFIRSVCWYFLNGSPDISSNISLIQLNSKVGGCSTLHWAAISPNPSCTSQFAADAIRTSFNGYSRFSKKWTRFKNLTFSVCLQHVLCFRNFILYIFLKYCSICQQTNQYLLKLFFCESNFFEREKISLFFMMLWSVSLSSYHAVVYENFLSYALMVQKCRQMGS